MARARDGRHIVTIEDPVEQIIEGLSQSQARPSGKVRVETASALEVLGVRIRKPGR